MSYLTAPQIAARLGVSRATAYRIARECLHIRVGVAGKSIRVPEQALTAYLARHTTVPEWGKSTNARQAARTGVTTPTRAGGTGGKRSAPAMRRSPAQGSGNSNWYQPIQPRTRGKR